jgi:DNA-binding NarL/FixJ family response regulator
MGGWPVLGTLLAGVAEQRYDDVSLQCLAALADPDLDPESEAQILSVLSVSEYYRGDFPAATRAAERAASIAEVAGTDAARLFGLTARALASAGLPPLPDDRVSPSIEAFESAWKHRGGLLDLPIELRTIAGRMLQEAAFATGRLAEAEQLDQLLEPVWETPLGAAGSVHPMIYFFQLFPVRFNVFTGRIAEAFEVAEKARDRAVENGHPTGILIATAVLCLVSGYRADRVALRAHVDTVLELCPEPTSHFAASCYLLAAYGLFAVDELARAAALVLRGNGGDGLPLAQTVDRALGYEILIAAALEAGEIELAQRYGELIVPLGSHPVAAPTVARVLGRLELAIGDALTGAENAEVAAARARLGGNHLEATMAVLLEARSLAEAGVRDRAIARFTDVAIDSQRLGSHAMRRSAVRELRRLGRRLRPANGAGWATLSPREKQIALLAADGHTNRIIGASLFLSERTVQAHLSRGLAALGISSRSALPRVIGEVLTSERETVTPPPLTPRQWDIVELVVEGVGNATMAERLGISVKTVEKHIGAIFLRWGVSSRTGIARIAVGESARRSA